MPHQLSFRISQLTGGAKVVVPYIDGTSLCDQVAAFEAEHGYDDPAGGYGGIVPEYMNYGPLDDYFLARGVSAARSEGGAQYLLACECGEAGCWPLMGRITALDARYRWDSFHNPFRMTRDYRAFGPFVFERCEYEAAISQLVSTLALATNF